MQPRHYYLSKNTEAFKHDSLSGVKHEHVVSDERGHTVGHIHWEGRDPLKRSAFESQGVIYLGTLLHKSLPAEAVAELAPYGVTANDSPYEALEKVQKLLGGFQLEI